MDLPVTGTSVSLTSEGAGVCIIVTGALHSDKGLELVPAFLGLGGVTVVLSACDCTGFRGMAMLAPVSDWTGVGGVLMLSPADCRGRGAVLVTDLDTASLERGAALESVSAENEALSVTFSSA